MQTYTAVVLGATGLTGNLLLQQLLNDASFSKVTILVRRPVAISHAKLVQHAVNFNDLPALREKLGRGDCIFCCLGTTTAKVKGDKAAYRHVDVDIPANVAKMGKAAGFKQFLLLSSVGAGRKNSFYLKIKGEAEKAVADQNFQAFHVFRPGILYGKRHEFRLGETIGKAFMHIADQLLWGALKKYHGVYAANVAKAMINAAKRPATGMYVYHYQGIQQLVQG